MKEKLLLPNFNSINCIEDKQNLELIVQLLSKTKVETKKSFQSDTHNLSYREGKLIEEEERNQYIREHGQNFGRELAQNYERKLKEKDLMERSKILKSNLSKFPILIKNNGKKVLVLDLDQTLVYACDSPKDNLESITTK